MIISNKELMQEFEKALEDESFGYVSEIPILQYNDENSLACVVTLAYLSARDTYRVEREEKNRQRI